REQPVNCEVKLAAVYAIRLSFFVLSIDPSHSELLSRGRARVKCKWMCFNHRLGLGGGGV
ncbi:MAG TPA: hypothetical protein VKK81_11565, partial [Candidatus Binatia bacterium]|nr:hypothetical protein [Candidatus Binatia bacterium]